MPEGALTKVALVTGAGAGLGWATAQRLAADGFAVICAGRRENVMERAESLRRGGGVAEGAVVDVTNPDAVVACVEGVAARWGRLDVLVNNAGGAIATEDGAPLAFEKTSVEDWMQSMALNLTAPFLFAREAFPHMKRNKWGRIVSISSRAARTGVPAADAPYSAAKAGLLGLTRFLAMRLAEYNITVNAIAAGRFGTDRANQQNPAVVAHAMHAIPLGRVGDPSELAATVSFLVSEGGGYLTGATLDVNGGAFIA